MEKNLFHRDKFEELENNTALMNDSLLAAFIRSMDQFTGNCESYQELEKI